MLISGSSPKYNEIQAFNLPQPTFDDLKEAVETKNLKQTQLLFSKIGPIEKNKLIELFKTALLIQDWNIALFFINNGICINEVLDDGSSFLKDAVTWGRIDRIAFLLEHGANPNQSDLEGLTPLHWAVFTLNNQIIELLIKNHADLNAKDKKGLAPLHLSISLGHIESTKILIDAHADINQQDARGVAPLHLAVIAKHSEIVELLIQKKVDVNLKLKNGNSVLHIAVNDGSVKIVQLLIEGKADVNQTNAVGLPPLYYAIEADNSKMVELLLQNHANINAPTKDLASPLFYAARAGSLEIMKLLLAYGADIDQKNIIGWTPLIEILQYKNGKRWNDTWKELSTIYPQSAEYAREFMQKKFIAHVNDIFGITNIIEKTNSTTEMSDEEKVKKGFALEMGTAAYFWSKIISNLEFFSKNYPESMSVETVSLLKKVLEQASIVDNTKKFEMWKKEEPFFVESGFPATGENIGHHASILIWKNHLVLCDRGNLSEKPDKKTCLIFPINVEKFDYEKFLKIVTRKKDKQEYLDFVSSLDKLLGSTPYKEQGQSLGHQLTQNCSWSNSSGLILPFLILQSYYQKKQLHPDDIARAKSIFYNWVAFTQCRVLEKYLKRITSPSYPYQIDYPLLKEAITNISVNSNKYTEPGLHDHWHKLERIVLSLIPRKHKYAYQKDNEYMLKHSDRYQNPR